MKAATLIIGLGNPILGDDGVGWKVVEHLSTRLAQFPAVETDCASLGGLSLMERMLGYSRVILIDAIETGKSPVGSVHVMPLSALVNPMDGHSASAHDTSLATALESARVMHLEVPGSVEVVAVEAHNTTDFSEQLTPDVQRAVPRAAEMILQLLKAERPKQ